MERRREDVLLHYLDARVRMRTGPPPARLKGTICVGVRRLGQMHWWIATFGDGVSTRFAAELPHDFDAGVAVDAETAMWILGAETAPGSLHLKTGDQALWTTFWKRYLEHQDMISVRLGGGV